MTTAAALALLCAACGLDLDDPPAVIHARFDPDDRAIPMPTNVVRDDDLGRLAIPTDDEELSQAERDLYTQLNEMDGWSSASRAEVEFDGVIDPATVTADNLQVWRWGTTPVRADGTTVTVAADGRSIHIDAPRTGWERGATYAVLLRGGEGGARGAGGEHLECDAAFYFLRLDQPLDTPEHERAFPGDTAEERRDVARKLEDLRVELAPFFDFFAARDLPRAEVAALWTFTVTERVELAMDKPSQRMPLPIDLLVDPATGKVELPAAAWDSETVAGAKERLADYDGFGTSQGLLFQLTGAVDPASVTQDTVELWRVGDGDPVREPALVELLADQGAIEMTPEDAPLAEGTTYAVVVRDDLVAADGTGPVVRMPAGHLLLGDAPVWDGAASLVGPVDDEDAPRLERVRTATHDFLGRRGRDGVLAAWTYTTMSTTAPMQEAIGTPAAAGVAVDPAIERRQTPGDAMAEFPLAFGNLWSVEEVVHGTIESTDFIDPATRANRPGGAYEVEEIAFTAAVPEDLEPGEPVPVLIFGHGLMTERRFVLAVADALAERGIASVSIDFPFHGTRAQCWAEGPLTIPDPTTGELTEVVNTCPGGATCQTDGRCLDGAGQTVPLRTWPVLDTMPVASGAAFIEIEHIANSRDHFRQGVVDLSALGRSLREGDWSEVFGRPVDASRIYYAGQSLGGILGATFTSLDPTVADAVLNVPGADTVDMFSDSTVFGPQIDAFFDREGVEDASFDGHRFMNVARWFMDSADPQTFARRLLARDGGPGPRRVLLQMATLDFIIPNDYTETLESISGAPRRDYVAEHGFLVLPVEPEYWRGIDELADFLTGDLDP
ncbi:MAG TPA: hypothetical protein VMZ28_28920 [Kofleriaceae bacterium]|nr:hypothetical protein [Kofleriaceae bacterium]